MRLLNVDTYVLEEFITDIPEYAILSHAWEEDEASFDDCTLEVGGKRRKDSAVDGSSPAFVGTETELDPDIVLSFKSHGTLRSGKMLSIHSKNETTTSHRQKLGWRKIEGACKQAKKDNYYYLWVDTCCIDKKSSSELSEAINSMFDWYWRAGICYVYLSDVPWRPDSPPLPRKRIGRSRWFERAWTLQELLAPIQVEFYSRDWISLGTKLDLSDVVTSRTRISKAILRDREEIWNQSVSRRMSWAATRQATRLEDRAYSLLGLFQVNMGMLYGEGEGAFSRLQQEIIKISSDQTIFLWKSHANHHTALASCPSDFLDTERIVGVPYSPEDDHYAITQRGLQIRLPLIATNEDQTIYKAVLGCHQQGDFRRQCVIYVKKADQNSSTYLRWTYRGESFGFVDIQETLQASYQSLYIPVDQRAGNRREHELFCRLFTSRSIVDLFDIRLVEPVGVTIEQYRQSQGTEITYSIKRSDRAFDHDLAAGFVFTTKRGSLGFMLAIYFPTRSIICTELTSVQIYAKSTDWPLEDWLSIVTNNLPKAHVRMRDVPPELKAVLSHQDLPALSTKFTPPLYIKAQLMPDTILNQTVYRLELKGFRGGRLLAR